MPETATFAAGSFWTAEVGFRAVEGIVALRVGYTGGLTPRPTYAKVSSGLSGHAEAVELVFDPEQVAYETLLARFWELHDPTQLNRQGRNVGTQYRSAIFVHSPAQERAALAARLQVQVGLLAPVVTQIAPAGSFHPAEAYHQRYLEKRGLVSCEA